VLVPYPHATGDHQAANARWMADGGAAIVLSDSELTPERLRTAVGALLDDGSRLEEMSAASRRLAKPEAAERIAHEVLEAAADA
jgi:UDP-N-acetylglucosamine--N-acetylmuramyl-(pentapeptide) pyrophosphoryl-undecaprenol N-acetylglucosamine transferase